jgi:type VI secretion system secreted protein VgrG
MAITQANRLLSLSTPLPYNQLVVRRLSAEEGISRLFQIDLDLLHEEALGEGPPFTIDPRKLVGQPMAVAVLQKEGDTEVERHFNGICISFAQGNRTSRWTKYHAVVVPRPWLLTQIRQSRIFQQKSVKDILAAVLKGFDFKLELKGTYEPRNYCVQYRESDWDFASRLMEEEGIFYFFEHTENGHTMILADSPTSHKPCPTKNKIEFAVDRSSEKTEWASSILTWRVDDRVRTGKYTLWDHTFELPGKELEAAQVSLFDIGGNKQLEIFDYPGGYAKRYDGIAPGGGEQSSEVSKVFQDNKRTVSIRQQEVDVKYKNFYGTSDCCSLVPGFRFEMVNHQHVEYNAPYVVATMRTEAVQSPSYVSDEPVAEPYSVGLVAIAYGKAPFRPERRTAKPIVHGSQSAVVVGPAGEEIFTDKYGRVKVQFNWDRHGRRNDTSSCWLRVAQMWAGKKWGTMFIPRIGMEVLVDFLEGDPDQPIIVGCVYNADNLPPYTLPDHKTRSTIKTNSSKGGGGFNEIRFEDKKGEEQIFIHAQKNQDVRVKYDNMEWIGNDRHLIVERDQFEKVKRDKHLQVTGDQVEKIDGNVHLKVGSNKEQKIGSKFAVDAGTEVHLKAGVSATIEAGTSLTLKVGGNFVNINSAGVFVKGAMVMLNSGGAAGSGGGASPGAPKDPKEADKDQAGERMQIASLKPPPTPPEFAALADLVRGGGGGAGPSVMAALAQAQSAAQAQAAQGIQSAQTVVGAVQQQAAGVAAAAMSAAQSKFDDVKDKVDELADKAKSKFDEAKDLANELKDKAEELADKAIEMAEEAKSKMEELENEIRSAVDSAVQMAEEKVAEAQKAAEEVKQQAEQAVQEAKEAVEETINKGEEAVNAAKEKLEQAETAARQAFSDAQAQADAAVEEAKQKVEEAKQQAAEAVEDAKEQVDAVKEEAEQQIAEAEQKVEEAKQQVEQAAQEAEQQVEQAAAQAQQQAEEVKQQAEQAAQQAQQAATDAAESAKEAATGAADDVKQAAEAVTQQTGQAIQGAKDAIPFM